MTQEKIPNYALLCFEMLRELEYLTAVLRRYGMMSEADRAGVFTRRMRKTISEAIFNPPPR